MFVHCSCKRDFWNTKQLCEKTPKHKKGRMLLTTLTGLEKNPLISLIDVNKTFGTVNTHSYNSSQKTRNTRKLPHLIKGIYWKPKVQTVLHGKRLNPFPSLCVWGKGGGSYHCLYSTLCYNLSHCNKARKSGKKTEENNVSICRWHHSKQKILRNVQSSY